MTALTTFLLARIAEDEEIARATAIPPWKSDGAHCVENHTWIAEVDGPEDGRHIARWDPARVLAECEAKRRIIVDWIQADAACGPYPGTESGYEMGLSQALDRLAQVYADHPDYQPEWSTND